MRLRRAAPTDYEAVGAVTVAAYEPFLLGAEDVYRQRLLDVASRDRDAEVWLVTPDDSDEVLGNVTICPEGSAWRELARSRARGSSGCWRSPPPPRAGAWAGCSSS